MDEQTDTKGLSWKLRELRARACVVCITFNDNRTGHASVHAHILELDPNMVGEIPDSGELVELQMYDKTPIGSVTWAGSDLEALVDCALAYVEWSGGYDVDSPHD